MARAPAHPDGYTIAMGNMGSILVTSITEPDLPSYPDFAWAAGSRS